MHGSMNVKVMAVDTSRI